MKSEEYNCGQTYSFAFIIMMCYIGSDSVGVLAYVVDFVLFAPTATAMRIMLHIHCM